MIAIIDYAAGNPASILNMLKKAGVKAVISSEPGTLEQADKLILPGVGAFDHGMNKLKTSGLIGILNKKVLVDKTPFLGVCLGMQLLTGSSEEGVEPGLGWIQGQTIRFRLTDERLKVPHMGWNFTEQKKESRLFDGMYNEPRFYFVHSYHVQCNNPEDILTTTTYGGPFVSSLEHENIAGVQFHPEKSHKYGLKLLKNFAELF